MAVNTIPDAEYDEEYEDFEYEEKLELAYVGQFLQRQAQASEWSF
jgi:hypothetical protein